MVKDVPPEIINQRMQEFAKLWQRFIELFDEGMRAESVTPEMEKEFRKLCVELTLRSQFLTLTVPDNIFDLWKDVRKLLAEIPSLEILRQEAQIRVSAFRNMWHEVSISLNQKQGHLRHRLEEM